MQRLKLESENRSYFILLKFTFHYAKIKTDKILTCRALYKNNLHSTMQRLKRNADESIFNEIVKFTFHYAKIKT